MIAVAPSLLSADFSRIGEEIKKIEEAGADLIHCDVMDGVFVPNITFGIKMIADIKKCTALPLDVHLMIVQPEKYLKQFIDAGADRLSFHVEAAKSTPENLAYIKNRGIKAGLAISPDTPIERLFEFLPAIDFITVMGVHPGFGSQKYIPETTERIKRLIGYIKYSGCSNILIEMDGGFNGQNAQEIISAGTDIVVSGSAFFSYDNPAYYVKGIKQISKI